jgi:hypothetical protein
LKFYRFSSRGYERIDIETTAEPSNSPFRIQRVVLQTLDYTRVGNGHLRSKSLAHRRVHYLQMQIRIVRMISELLSRRRTRLFRFVFASHVAMDVGPEFLNPKRDGVKADLGAKDNRGIAQSAI